MCTRTVTAVLYPSPDTTSASARASKENVRRSTARCGDQVLIAMNMKRNAGNEETGLIRRFDRIAADFKHFLFAFDG